MDITYNKVDQTQLPINPSRVSASEYNQIAGSLMYIINASGLTPDSQNNEQLLNALKATIISFPYIVETYSNGTSWYRVWSDGWCEQGGCHTFTSNAVYQVILLKEFADTNYNIQHSLFYNTYDNKYVDNCTAYSASTITIAPARSYVSGMKVWWKAEGYIL